MTALTPGMFTAHACSAAGCPKEAEGSCPDCGGPLCGRHFFSPREEHRCVPVIAPAVQPCHKRGEVLVIAGTRFSVFYCMNREQSGGHHTLIVEPVHGIAFHYAVRVERDGAFSRPELIPESCT